MINHKQYIIMDEPFAEDGFTHLPLSAGKILSVQDDLKREIRLNEEGKAEICLLGYAFQSDPGRGLPFEEALRITKPEEIPEVTGSWSGTWLLIWRDVLYMDACGLIGCFYTDGGIISGSLHCINQALHRADRPVRLAHQFGLDYYPGPGTVYPDVKRLMSSRHLLIPTCRAVRHELFPGIPAYADDEERTKAALACFSQILKSFRETYDGEIYLALTGGYDSRVTMALLEMNEIPYRPFTLEYDSMSGADRTLPAKLAERMGKEYLFCRRSGLADRRRIREYDEHCALMSKEEDRSFYAYHQYPEGEGRRHAILRSGIWGVVLYSFPYVERCRFDIGKYAGRLVNVRGRSDIRASLGEWLRDVEKEADEGRMELISRFYWEQRAGCWLADAEQALTVMEDVDSFQLLNCARLLAILYSFDRSLRETKEHERMMIRMACPELLEEPFDTHTPAKKTRAERIRNDFTYMGKCLRCLDRDAAMKECRKRAKKLLRDIRG